MKRFLLAALAAFSACTPAYAQDADIRRGVALAADFNLNNAGSFVYPSYTGRLDQLLGPARGEEVRGKRLKTVGSSTTVSAFTAGTAPFALLAVGDILVFSTSGVTPAGTVDATIGLQTFRQITAKADSDNVTVDAAIDLSTGTGFGFAWYKAASGTAATDGWVPVTGYDEVHFCWQITQSDGASIDVKVEGEDVTARSSPVPMFAKNYTATYGCAAATPTCDCFTIIPNGYDRIRLGFRINTDASDAGANIEKISAQVRLEQ